jgi:chemotaxis family two-component system response regulator Rcp1
MVDKRNVLLIEDNPSDVFLVREALTQHDVDVDLTVLSNCELALAYLDSVDTDDTLRSPDLAMVDLKLPRGDSADILKRIRSSPKFGHIPIIVLTGSEAPEDRASVAGLGSSVFFRKPTTNLDEFLRLGSIVKHLLAD